MDEPKVLARYELVREQPPFDTMWTDIREAAPRCRVRPTGDRAVVSVIQEGSERRLEVEGEIEQDNYEDDKYQEIRDEEIK